MMASITGEDIFDGSKVHIGHGLAWLSVDKDFKGLLSTIVA
jgi:hypothetical protein